MKNSVIVPLAILLCSSLIIYDTEKVFAAGFTLVDYGGGQAPDSITRQGSFIFVGSVGSDNVKVFNVADNSLVTTIAGVTDPEALYIGSDATRVYSLDSDGSLIEIDAVNHAVLRSLAHGCTGSLGTVASNFLYCSTGAEVINKINLASMSTVFSSTTLNAGGTPCDGIQGLTYDSNSDIMFAGCNTSNRVVAVEGFLTSGTPDFSFAYTGARLIAWNEDNTNILICSSSVARQLVDYTTGAGFTSLVTIGDATETCNSTPHLVYHSASNRFIMETAASTETLQFIDGSDGSQLYSQALSGTSNAEQVFAYSNDIVYGARANTDDWFIFDTSGIPLGAGGSEEEEPVIIGGVNCSLPENENKLICRVTDPIGGAGNFVIGNGTSGLTGIGCSIGLVDCSTDTNPRTNGLGLLIFIASLFLLVGMFYLTIGRDAFQIPIYIWILIILADAAFFTITGLIDPIFLILAAVGIIALAASRLKSVILGGSTMGEGSSA